MKKIIVGFVLFLILGITIIYYLNSGVSPKNTNTSTYNNSLYNFSLTLPVGYKVTSDASEKLEEASGITILNNHGKQVLTIGPMSPYESDTSKTQEEAFNSIVNFTAYSTSFSPDPSKVTVTTSDTNLNNIKAKKYIISVNGLIDSEGKEYSNTQIWILIPAPKNKYYKNFDSLVFSYELDDEAGVLPILNSFYLK